MEDKYDMNMLNAVYTLDMNNQYYHRENLSTEDIISQETNPKYLDYKVSVINASPYHDLYKSKDTINSHEQYHPSTEDYIDLGDKTENIINYNPTNSFHYSIVDLEPVKNTVVTEDFVPSEAYLKPSPKDYDSNRFSLDAPGTIIDSESASEIELEYLVKKAVKKLKPIIKSHFHSPRILETLVFRDLSHHDYQNLFGAGELELFVPKLVETITQHYVPSHTHIVQR